MSKPFSKKPTPGAFGRDDQRGIGAVPGANLQMASLSKLRLTKLPTKPFSPRTQNQAAAKKQLEVNDLCFLVGPAGTGKTFLAARQAVEDVITGRATKIILTRAAVEAGESIGFLPGSVVEKMKLYVQPMLDALGVFWSPEIVDMLIAANVIQLIPLTYLRGNSLDNAVIIVDEFQNATPSQGKLALTRAGENCRTLVTCDPDQCDLPLEKESAIQDLWRFENTSGIAFIDFKTVDVVRSAICKTVLKAYLKNDDRAA